MRPTIDFKECLKDSPKFRASLEEAECDIDTLELTLERLVKLCSIMIETGKAFNNASSGFVFGVRDMASYFSTDNLVSEDNKVAASLNRFAHAMTEMLKYFSILMDQAHRSVCKNINNFIRNDVKKVKEAKKHFEKISDDMDNALNRNSQSPKSKPQECEETTNSLVAMKSAFAHTTLDYVFHINILHSKKRVDVLETMLSFMHAQNTFFHQGHDLFKDLDPYMKNIATQVEELSIKFATEKKDMEERHTLVQQKELTQLAINTLQTGNDSGEEPGDHQIEGYLFKRTSNAFKTWVRRWFYIQDKQLVYCKRSKDVPTVMEEDLRLCTVKPTFELDRRFCFEVVSPTRSHMLQADTEQDCKQWMLSIQAGVTKAYRDCIHNALEAEEEANASVGDTNTSLTDARTPVAQKPQSKLKIRMEQLLAIPGNDRCCDCGCMDPKWTSINLGITFCIECSGIHRSFGVHMSKVRSMTLDAWEPELVKVMVELGNDVVNRIFEANVDEATAVRATPDCNRNIREAWIRAKYIKKAFVAKLPGHKNLGGSKFKSWSVRKKTKRSPARTLTKDESPSDTDERSESDSPGGMLEAVLSVSNVRDNDSGLGEGSADMIVFGQMEQILDIHKSLDLESSEESSTECDDADDAKSTTSWEDMSKLDPNMLLYKAAQARNLTVMMEALAHGGNPNWVNEEDDGKTPLMKAVETNSLTTCEFLLLNGAKLDKKDRHGNMPLHHATLLGHTGQVCQFLKRGADIGAKDNNGMDALTMAVNAANADIVTLLRLAKLNEEMKETDGLYGNPGDATFQDVFRDFTNMASNNPEKLKRK